MSEEVLHPNGTIKMSIEYKKGDILQANAEALVNTVNTVGVMGKGIALAFEYYQKAVL